MSAPIYPRLAGLAPEYTYAEVWCLFWADGNLKFKNEGRQVRQFFEETMGFTGVDFPIQHSSSFWGLNTRISGRMESLNERVACGEKCYIVLHYSGHGMQNDNIADDNAWSFILSEQNEKGKGGSVLGWALIQEILGFSNADILLVLDSCFSGQAMRTKPFTPNHQGSGSIELLASSVDMARMPGIPGAFTDAFLHSLRERFRNKNSPPVKIRTVVQQMLYKREIKHVYVYEIMRGSPVQLGSLALPKNVLDDTTLGNPSPSFGPLGHGPSTWIKSLTVSFWSMVPAGFSLDPHFFLLHPYLFCMIFGAVITAMGCRFPLVLLWVLP